MGQTKQIEEMEKGETSEKRLVETSDSFVEKNGTENSDSKGTSQCYVFY